MLTEQTLMAVAYLQRKIYTSLTEIAELTNELSDALNRRDQVSVRLFLSMRREEINLLLEHKAVLDRQYQQLPKEDSAALQQLISGNDASVPDSPGRAALLRQLEVNHALLERICRTDESISL